MMSKKDPVPLLSHKLKFGDKTVQNDNTKASNRPLGRAPTMIS
ncbi:protein of unknown function [uncultured Woeseiaceae bacterium]|uniref:Uncharacterized protein n=1 Tax=uncultured Woeseiaceae bacterium TaxID=1983305 RepID=A0A7D9H660_9GAMM|nr:protein of unknown function [uncultured Woeseiaceae bacterium]